MAAGFPVTALPGPIGVEGAGEVVEVRTTAHVLHQYCQAAADGAGLAPGGGGARPGPLSCAGIASAPSRASRPEGFGAGLAAVVLARRMLFPVPLCRTAAVGVAEIRPRLWQPVAPRSL